MVRIAVGDRRDGAVLQCGRRGRTGARHDPATHVIKTGKTTVLDAEQARKLLDSIDTSLRVGCATGR
jgi:hypothetical protein